MRALHLVNAAPKCMLPAAPYGCAVPHAALLLAAVIRQLTWPEPSPRELALPLLGTTSYSIFHSIEKAEVAAWPMPRLSKSASYQAPQRGVLFEGYSHLADAAPQRARLLRDLSDARHQVLRDFLRRLRQAVDEELGRRRVCACASMSMHEEGFLQASSS